MTSSNAPRSNLAFLVVTSSASTRVFKSLSNATAASTWSLGALLALSLRTASFCTSNCWSSTSRSAADIAGGFRVEVNARDETQEGAKLKVVGRDWCWCKRGRGRTRGNRRQADAMLSNPTLKLAYLPNDMHLKCRKVGCIFSARARRVTPRCGQRDVIGLG